MRLSDGEVGKSYIIKSIEGGCMAKDRLLKLGLIPGSIITLKRKAPLKGPLMVEINGNDVVVGRGISVKIIIEELA